MTKKDLLDALEPLSSAFEKTIPEKLFEVWWNELKAFSLIQVKSAVSHFLNSEQKTFPRIGEFKIALIGKGERRTPEGRHEEPPSCDRCHHGIATVIRYIDQRKHSFAFRCSCASGAHYPGFPLVSDDEQTLKESRSASRTIPYPEPAQWQKRQIVEDRLEHIPF